LLNQYELEELKMMCEVFLGFTLTIDKAVDMLLLADMHNANELKSTCIRYIASNAARVRQTESWWKLAMSDRIDLMEQLFMSAAFSSGHNKPDSSN